MSDVSFDHFFMTLGNKQRVHILQLLENNGPMSVSAIASCLAAEQSSVSHSLKHLLNCHFVTVNQSGKERIFAIKEDTVRPIFQLIGQHVNKYCVKECNHSRKRTTRLVGKNNS